MFKNSWIKQKSSWRLLLSLAIRNTCETVRFPDGCFSMSYKTMSTPYRDEVWNELELCRVALYWCVVGFFGFMFPWCIMFPQGFAISMWNLRTMSSLRNISGSYPLRKNKKFEKRNLVGCFWRPKTVCQMWKCIILKTELLSYKMW